MKQFNFSINDNNEVTINDNPDYVITINGTPLTNMKCYIDGNNVYISEHSIIAHCLHCNGPVISEWDYYNDTDGGKCLSCNKLLSNNEWLRPEDDIVSEYKEHLSSMEDDFWNHPEYFSHTTLKEYCNDRYNCDLRDEYDENSSLYYKDSEGFFSKAAKLTYEIIRKHGFIDEPWVEFNKCKPLNKLNC